MADLTLVNANVLTMDPDPLARPRAGAVAITGGRIEAVAADADGLSAGQAGAAGAGRVVDLRGATLMPGFHDAHNHMTGFGMSLAEVDLRSPPIGSLDELYAAIAARAASTAPGDWVVGSGYDQNKLGAHPHRDALDRAAPGRRVWLRHTSGHMCVVNGLVLADLGLDAAATQVPGGRVGTDPDGRPSGLLEEQAQVLAGTLVYPYPLAQLTQAIDRAGAHYLTEGITSCTEAGVGGGWVSHSPVELAAYSGARDQGRLHVRVELMVAAEALHRLGAHPDDGLDLGLDLGIRSGFGDDWLRIGPVKIFADGSLVGRTAAVYDEYAGVAGAGRGYLQADAADLQATIIAAHRSGWQVATHAIGDRAIDVVLDAYAQAMAQYPRRGPRHRIEHFAVAQPRQVSQAAGLGVIAVPQGRFASELGDGMLAAVGPERHDWLYRQRSLLEAGMVLPGSSDRPVVAGAPLPGIADMVLRRTASGAPFNPGEAVTVPQALYAYTAGSAYASHQEHVKGSITPGKLADLVILSEDPTAVSPDRIAGLAVLATLIDGQCRYDRGAIDGLT
ncbi:MAG: amidohydrolase [Streptosporangiaceae bacterium]|jgi:predicted amidohydrolase YtcJ